MRQHSARLRMLSTLLPLVHASLSAPQLARAAHTVSSKKLRLAVVGDVHGEFEDDEGFSGPGLHIDDEEFGGEDQTSQANVKRSLPAPQNWVSVLESGQSSVEASATNGL